MELVDLSQKKLDDQDFVGLLNSFCEQLEMKHASYATTNWETGQVLGYANYSPGWVEFYSQNNFQNCDPTIHVSSRSIAPVDWADLQGNRKFKDVFEPASEFGVSSAGITVPVRGPFGEVGLLSFSGPESPIAWDKKKRQIINQVQAVAAQFHDSVMASSTLSGVFSKPSLSSREIEILHWVAAGKTAQDVADILNVSAKTVDVYLRSARTKLNALSTPQAIGRAVGFGFIQPG